MTELNPKAFAPGPDAKVIGLRVLDSVALTRLIEEVRQADGVLQDTTAYNRTYHRHNR